MTPKRAGKREVREKKKGSDFRDRSGIRQAGKEEKLTNIFHSL